MSGVVVAGDRDRAWGDDVTFALNHMTVPTLGYGALLDLAAATGCVGVEVRNDLARPLFDGMAPAAAGQLAREAGLRLVGLSQVYPFNRWSDAIAAEVRALIEIAVAAGAETISLIPAQRRHRHRGRRAAAERARGAVGDPADARRCRAWSPWSSRWAFAARRCATRPSWSGSIEALEARDAFRLVHDTFHHPLAGGGPIYPELTGIVHISAVVDPALALDKMDDAHRVLIDAQRPAWQCRADRGAAGGRIYAARSRSSASRQRST